MMSKTIAIAALLVVAIALNAYAPHPGGAGGHDTDKANTDTAQLKALQDSAIYYAPNKQIGTLKSGARVQLIGTRGNWAHVRFASERIVVEGWILKAHLARLTEKDIDALKGLKNQQEQERRRAKDLERDKDKNRD